MRAKGLNAVLILCALTAYAVFLGSRMAAWPGGSDSSGYLNNARLMSTWSFHPAQRSIPGVPAGSLPGFAYVPLGFTPMGGGRMVPTYPMGFPALVAAAARVVGWDWAPPLTMGLHALASPILMLVLARRFGLGALASWTGAVILAASPVFLFVALQSLSDVPAVAWAAAAMAAALARRRSPGIDLIAGISLSVAILTRPTNALLLPAFGLAVGAAWRRWPWVVLGGLPGAVFLGVMNHALYGTVFASGYGRVDVLFSPAFVAESLRSYGVWLPVALSPALVCAAAAPWSRLPEDLGRRGLAVLFAWALAYPAFYGFYFHTHEAWWYQRFLLPAFPAMLLLMLLGGRRVADWFPGRWRIPFGILVSCGLVAWMGYWTHRLVAAKVANEQLVYRQSVAWLGSHAPADAAVVCMQVSGAAYYGSTRPIIRWDQIKPADFGRIAAACRAQKRPIFAILFPFEVGPALKEHLLGDWEQVGVVREASVWRLRD